MSIRLMTRVWGLALKPSVKLILLKLCDNASDEGLAWPSIDRIARETGCSRRTVQYQIKAFIDNEIIWLPFGSGGGRGRPNHYQIDMDRAEALCGNRNGEKGAGGDIKGADSCKPPTPPI